MRGKREDRNLIVGLDIGTSKVAAIVGAVSPENTVEVIGVGSSATPAASSAGWWWISIQPSNPSAEPWKRRS